MTDPTPLPPVEVILNEATDEVTIKTTPAGLFLLGLSASLAFALTSDINQPFRRIARLLLTGGGVPADAIEDVMAALYEFTDIFSDVSLDAKTMLAAVRLEENHRD